MAVQSRRMVVVSGLPGAVKEEDVEAFCSSMGDLLPGPLVLLREEGGSARAYLAYMEEEGQLLAIRW